MKKDRLIFSCTLKLRPKEAFAEWINKPVLKRRYVMGRNVAKPYWPVHQCGAPRMRLRSTVTSHILSFCHVTIHTSNITTPIPKLPIPT